MTKDNIWQYKGNTSPQLALKTAKQLTESLNLSPSAHEDQCWKAQVVSQINMIEKPYTSPQHLAKPPASITIML